MVQKKGICRCMINFNLRPKMCHMRHTGTDRVPAVSGDVRVLARERAEGTRPRTCRAVREDIGEIKELAAFEAVGCHVVLQPENFWDFHFKLNENMRPSLVSTRGLPVLRDLEVNVR